MANAKTLRKRIALVAATALGVGVLVAAPASAANIPSSAVNSLNLTLGTATTPATGSTVVVNAGAATVATTVSASDTSKFVGYLSSYPVGGFVQVAAETTTAGTTNTNGTVTAITGTTTSISGATLTATASGTSVGGNTITSSTSVGFGSFQFTPAVAGTYILTVWNDANADGAVSIGEAVQTISVTVGAAATYSAGYSTAYIASGAAAGVSPDATVSFSKALPSAQAANITVTLKNTSNAAINGETISATVSGPGTLGITDGNTTYGQPSSGRAVSQLLADNIGNVSVWSDGTAGVSTITISVTDATSGATTVLATKTVTFYGAVASLAVATQYYFVAKTGAGTSGITTGLTATSDSPAVTVKALDANGVVVPGVTITGLSSDTNVIASSTVAEDTAGNDAAGTYGGPGYYNASVTSGSLATSGQSATVTYRYTANGGVTYISAPAVTFTIGGTTPATVTFALDAATYAPGAKAVLTVTVKDSAGNPVADGTYANLLAATATTNAAVQGALPGASVATSKGVKTYTIYAPVNPVAFTVSGTLGTSVATAAQGTTVSAAASVTAVANPDVAAAKAAADAATAAVASLSTTVATLFASISYQVRVLNVLIKRIMSKLRIK